MTGPEPPWWDREARAEWLAARRSERPEPPPDRPDPPPPRIAPADRHRLAAILAYAQARRDLGI